MSKNPVLGVVPCTHDGCKGRMTVRQSNRGRGGHTRLYGHCDTCKALAQSKADQDHLSRYLKDENETGSTQLDAAPVEVSGVTTGEDWDPAKTPPKPATKTPRKAPQKGSGGGVLKLVFGVLAIAGVALGAGALASR